MGTPVAIQPRSHLTHRLVVFTGKGGVGKTSLSAAFADMAGKAGKKVLLVEARSSKSIPWLFEQKPQGNGPQPLSEHIDWINLTAKDALETYAMKILKWRSVYRAVFEQRAVQRFLRAIPALAEILILGHLVHLIEQGRFDLTVLDAPSSISGSLMLGAPQAIMETAPQGPLTQGAAWINDLLTDPKQTVINLVTTPEELPVNEAAFLHRKLKTKLGLPLGMLFINRVIQDPFASLSNDLVDIACRAVAGLKSGRAFSEASLLLKARIKLQKAYLDHCKNKVELEQVVLPELLTQTSAPAIVRELTEKLGQHLKEYV